MANFYRKCLVKRDECFSVDGSARPRWLAECYPQLNVDEDDRTSEWRHALDEETNEDKDFPFTAGGGGGGTGEENFIDRIVQLETNKSFSSQSTDENQVEYPHLQSYFSLVVDHFQQLIVHPSDQQLEQLFTEIQRRLDKRTDPSRHQPTPSSSSLSSSSSSSSSKSKRCEATDCPSVRLPLSSFCSRHFFAEEKKQVFFDRCSLCQQIFIKHDDKHLLLLSACSHSSASSSSLINERTSFSAE